MKVDGFLNIYKPPGPTSHDMVRSVKKLLCENNEPKIGHIGTLDPPASGVLIIAVGKGNRLVEYVLRHPKEYTGLIRLGALTDTLDSDGEITMLKDVPEFSQKDLDNLIPKFTGTFMQVPPAVSALKKDGVRYYVRARRGDAEEPPARKATSYELRLRQIDFQTISLYVQCASGFYVRSLARDIASELNTLGFLDNLVRTAVGNFQFSDSIDIEWIEKHGRIKTFETHLHPLDFPMEILPRIDVDSNQVKAFRLGNIQPVQIPDGFPIDTDIAVFGPDGFTGIGEIRQASGNSLLKPNKVIVKA